MKNFKRWPGNFKFAYVCAIAAVIVGVILFFMAANGMDRAMAAVSFTGGIVVVIMAPRWALDDEQERAARKRARQARADLRRSKR